MPKLKMVVVLLLMFPVASFAALKGDYLVSAMVTKPALKQCFFNFSIQTDANVVTLSDINCGPIHVLGGPIKIEGQGGLPGDR